MTTSPRDPRVRRLLLAAATAVLAALTTYLVLDRNHAEELGGGSRAVGDMVRGGLPLGPLTWAVAGLLAVAYLVRRAAPTASLARRR